MTHSIVELQAWLHTYCLHPETRDRLAVNTQVLVDAVACLNRSARAGTYAFLDAAHGGPIWMAERVSAPVLRELRRYDLRKDAIREPWHIDARYGAFFGCADATLLRQIVRLAQEEPTHPLHEAANWSLSSVCREFPHVAAAVLAEGGEA